jgi:predicted RNA-binding protein YlqC (UPF0109 family)
MSATATVPREEILAQRLANFLHVIANAIARSKTPCRIEHFPNQATLTLSVDQKDQGRFIGKHGSTIWGIQTLFWFAGLAQFGYTYSVKLLGPEKPPGRRVSPPIKFNPKWPRKKIHELAGEILWACLPQHADYTIEEEDETRATIKLRLPKYLEMQMSDPNFSEAFATVMKTAGMSNGVAIKTETTYN